VDKPGQGLAKLYKRQYTGIKNIPDTDSGNNQCRGVDVVSFPKKEISLHLINIIRELESIIELVGKS